MDNSKVLIVGSNGYIGSHLASRLIELNHDVILTDIGDESVIPNANYAQVDFTDRSTIPNLLSGVDFVYFFAGRTGNSNEGFDNADSFISSISENAENICKPITHIQLCLFGRNRKNGR